MEILNARQQVLTNFEVLQTLRVIKDQKIANSAKNLATITYETVQHLESTACKNQSHEGIETFIREAQKIGTFTKSEILAMINDPPTLVIHVNLIVEDSEERGMTDTQIEQLIELSRKYLVTN